MRMSEPGGFVDRRADLAFLEERWETDGLEMVVVTGRRRVGKTTLLKAFMQDKPHVYHLVNREEDTLQLRRFRDALVEELGGPTPETEDWHDLFAYLEEKLEDGGRFLVVVDEFPYLVEEDDSIPSYFQALLDEYLTDTQAFMCLCGSSVGMMEEEVLASKSPLYGRRTGRIDLRPFRIQQARAMFRQLPLEQLVQVYAVFGGTPHYLQFVEPEATLADEIEQRIVDPRGPLHDEPELLIGQEFRRPHRYVSIVQAVAEGRTRPKEIADHTGISQQSVPKYLSELERVRLLERHVPVTEQRQRSRRGIYKLSDPFFAFWYRFVAPHGSQAEEDATALTRNRIVPELPAYVGRVFESVCRQLVPDLFEGYGRVGSWWYQEHEVDVAALDENGDRLLLAECKWVEDVDAQRLVDELTETAKLVRWRQGSRDEELAIFAKSFERRTSEARCLDLEDLDEQVEWVEEDPA